jgi:hypothetical protein
MQAQEDPIKRLRTSLGLKQKPFGALFEVGQSTVSDWEQGAPLPPETAVVLWRRYGSRLRGMGVKFEALVLARSGYKRRERGKRRRRRAGANGSGAGQSFPRERSAGTSGRHPRGTDCSQASAS